MHFAFPMACLLWTAAARHIIKQHRNNCAGFRTRLQLASLTTTSTSQMHPTIASTVSFAQALSLSLSQSLSIKLSIPLSLRPFPPIRPSPESELCPGKSHGMAKLANGRGLMDKCSAMSPCKPLRLTKSDDVQCPESKGSNMIQCITSMFGNGLCSCKRPWPFIDSSASHPATAHGLRQPSPKRNKVAPKHQEPIPLVCLATGLHLACVHCTNLPHNLH